MVAILLAVLAADPVPKHLAETIYDGKVAGNNASWKADIKNPMPLTLEFDGGIAGDTITGTVSAAVGSWPFSGSRSA